MRPSLTPISASAFAGMIDDGRALEEKIEGFGQVRLLLLGLAAPSHKCRSLGSRRTVNEPLPCGPLADPRRRAGRRRRRAQISARADHQRYRQGASRAAPSMPACSRRKGRSCSTFSWCRTGTASCSKWRKAKAARAGAAARLLPAPGAGRDCRRAVFAVAAAWGAPPAPADGAIAYADPRLPALGFRILLPTGDDLGRSRLRRRSRSGLSRASASRSACPKAGATTPSAMPFRMRRCSIS